MRIVVLGQSPLAKLTLEWVARLGHEAIGEAAVAEASTDRWDSAVLADVTNGEETRTLLKQVEGRVGQIVIAGSQTVYAPYGGLRRVEELVPSSIPISESAPLRTARHFESMEYLEVEAAAIGISSQVRIIRLPVLYGEGATGWLMEPFVQRMLARRPAIILPPDVGNFRWTHGAIANAAHVLALAASMTGSAQTPENPRILHMGEGALGYTPTVGERLHTLARAIGYRGQIVVLPRDVAPAHLSSTWDLRFDLVANDHALRRELGYAEVMTEKEALTHLVNFIATRPVALDAADLAAEDAILARFGLLPKKKNPPT